MRMNLRRRQRKVLSASCTKRNFVDGGKAAKVAPLVRKWSLMATKMAKAYVSKANKV